MFGRTPTTEELETVRSALIAQLSAHDGDSEEYKRIMVHVETLSNLIDQARPKKLDVNTLAMILGNFGIAGLVLWHERDHVVTTKMFSFLGKK